MSRYPLVPVDPTIVIPQPKGRRVSKELLIRQLQAFHKKYGIVPKSNDAHLSSELSSQASYYGHLGESWDAILAAAGLPTSFEQEEAKKEEYLDKLVKFAKTHKRAPKSSELGPKYDMPTYMTYRRLFSKSWEGILEEVGMQGYRYREPGCSQDRLHTLLKEYYLLYGISYDHKRAGDLGLPTRLTIEVYLGKKWSHLMEEICQAKKQDASEKKNTLFMTSSS